MFSGYSLLKYIGDTVGQRKIIIESDVETGGMKGYNPKIVKIYC